MKLVTICKRTAIERFVGINYFMGNYTYKKQKLTYFSKRCKSSLQLLLPLSTFC